MTERNLTRFTGPAAAVSTMFLPVIAGSDVIFSGALRPLTLVFAALIHMAPAEPSIGLKPQRFYYLPCFLHHKSTVFFFIFVALVKEKSELQF